jgi:hypothetical protein
MVFGGMDIRISLRRTKRGTTLATVRVLTHDEVIWHRITLPEEADFATFQRNLIAMTLAHLGRHGGPAGKLVTFQLALPAGGR